MKSWLLEVILKQGGPSAIRGVFLFALTWLAAHAGLLDKFGGHYDPITHILSWNIDLLQKWVEGAGLAAGGAALIKVLNYHASEAVAPK